MAGAVDAAATCRQLHAELLSQVVSFRGQEMALVFRLSDDLHWHLRYAIRCGAAKRRLARFGN